MSARTALIVGVLWLASLAAVAATTREQARQTVPPPEPKIDTQVQVQDQRILSGADIGFRLEGWDRNTPTGTLVIRLNGRWVEPTTVKKVMPITR
jgi:hypothetical protein